MIVSLATALLLAFGSALPDAAARCRVEGGVQPHSAADIRALVHKADVVVRVRALDQRRPPELRGFPPVQVQFEILEVLHGPKLPPVLWIRGALSEEDDFNTGSVPYPLVRRNGLRGSCYAYFYRKGGEFLLLLREQNGELSPYWGLFAPTNEQVRGVDDPWVLWVREALLQSRTPGA